MTALGYDCFGIWLHWNYCFRSVTALGRDCFWYDCFGITALGLLLLSWLLWVITLIFCHILAKTKYFFKNIPEFFSKLISNFRPKSAENAARKSLPGFQTLQFGLRAGSGCPKIVRAGGPSPKTGTSLQIIPGLQLLGFGGPGRAFLHRALGLARGPQHHYTIYNNVISWNFYILLVKNSSISWAVLVHAAPEQ